MNFEPLTKSCLGGMLAIAFFLTLDHLPAQSEPMLRFDRVVAMTSVAGNERKLSSAFFVLYAERMFIVTAKHSALETNLTTEIALPSVGALRIFKLADAIQKPGVNPWIAHDSADVAACEIDLSKVGENFKQRIETMAIAVDQCQRKLPLRSSRIEVIGFPMGLGVTPERISPLVTNCFVASEELNLNGTWGKEANFFGAPAVGSGASGGMVTLHEEDAQACTMIGVFIGFNGDASGAKLARILPARVLVDFIESHCVLSRGEAKQVEKSQAE